MRIIKLSKDEFENLEEVFDFFQRKLYYRNPEGQFRLPSSKTIQKDEMLLFSYEKVVRFTAIAKEGVSENHDELSVDYPYHFIIDMDTLESAKMSLEKVEAFVRGVYDKSIAGARSWSKIPDSPTTNELWDMLRKK